MTKEEAIKILRREIECLSHTKCEDCILEVACDPIKTTPYDSEYIEVYEMAISALSENKGEWIPVSERLPEDGKFVLFCDIDDDIMVGYHVKGRPRTHFTQDFTFEDMKNVRAWQPLPEPYKAESEDKE